MRVLIQNCETHLYYRSNENWTPDAEQARSFATSEQAIIFCREQHLPAVQIVLKFPSDEYDIRVPISDECEHAR